MDTGYRTQCNSPPLHHQSPSRGYSPEPPPRNVETGKKKKLSERTVACCGGDTRWPPQGGNWRTPLNFLYGDVNNEKRRIFHHPICGNSALEVRDWIAEFDERVAEAASKSSAE
jgi:hypothetical protein